MTYFSLEVVNCESPFSVSPTEEEIILLFSARFIKDYDKSKYTYRVFVRDFFECISYYQITADNLYDKIGSFKKIFHKAYNILMQLERVCQEVFVTSFDEDDAQAMLSRYNKETLRHWVLATLRAGKNNLGNRNAWENSNYTALYNELAELAVSKELFEERTDTIKEFLFNLNADGMLPVLHINADKTSQVAIFLGMLKESKLIHGRYQKIIQDKRCLIGAEGNLVSSSTLSSAKHLYWYRFEDGDELAKNQETPVDSLIVAFRSICNDFMNKS